jgi:hypothetical protein
MKSLFASDGALKSQKKKKKSHGSSFFHFMAFACFFLKAHLTIGNF